MRISLVLLQNGNRLRHAYFSKAGFSPTNVLLASIAKVLDIKNVIAPKVSTINFDSSINNMIKSVRLSTKGIVSTNSYDRLTTKSRIDTKKNPKNYRPIEQPESSSFRNRYSFWYNYAIKEALNIIGKCEAWISNNFLNSGESVTNISGVFSKTSVQYSHTNLLYEAMWTHPLTVNRIKNANAKAGVLRKAMKYVSTKWPRSSLKGDSLQLYRWCDNLSVISDKHDSCSF